MKRIIGLLIVLMMLISVTVGLAGGTTATDTQPENAKEYKKTLNIVTPEPVIETCWDHDVLSISGYNFMIEPSVPMLPMKTVSLVIPQSAEIKSIKVLSSTKEKMRGDYDILPVQEPVPVSRNTPVAFTPKNPSIYASSNPYPGKLIKYAGEGNLRDYRILSINIYPLQYNPAGKKLTYYDNIEIEVTYTAPPSKTEKTEDDEFSKMVKAMVSNPEDVDTLSITTTEATSSILTEQNVDYVIITSNAFEDEFQRLVDHKISKGLSAEVVTLVTISEYNGNDTQERIRNFIIDAKATWGTKWILLGGDTDIIPPRLAYSLGENIPTDLYYSDLDGTWDADGDSRYGETIDNIDLYPDVFVGRAPINTTTEADTFVNKTITYELGPSGYETTSLFMAEYLDVKTDGGITKNLIDSESIPDTFTVTKLYESLGNLNYNSAMAKLNEGYGIINHIGHANYDVLCIGPSDLNNTDMDLLINSPKNSIFYSIGCLSNALDRDSIAEHFILNQNGGGIAYIGNSRYGWYSPGKPGVGPSERYDREFFKSLFTEGFENIGETLADSKAAYVPSSQYDGSYRYIQYALNLLGDPETQIWTANIPTPPELSVIVTSPTMANINENFTVEAIISNSGTETANGVNATISWIPESGLSTSEPLIKSVDNISGSDSVTVSWNVSANTTGTYNITINAFAANAAPANNTTTVEVILPDLTPPTVALQSPEDNATVDDGIILFQYIPDDTQSGISNCELIINGNLSTTDDTIMEGSINNFTALMTAGNYTWNVNCTDDSPNTNEGCGTERTLIVEDRIPPVNGFILIQDANGYTNDNEPDLYLSAVGADYMAFSCNNTSFSNWINYDEFYTDFNVETGAGCTLEDGPKTIYVKFKDEAGNEGAYANDTTILDRTAPTDGYITIIDNDDYTNDNEPDLNLSAVSADYMAFSCNNLNFSGWIANTTSYSSFNMETGAGCTEGDGQKTIYVKYKDEAGNEGAYANDTTILDKAAPTVGYISIIDNDGYTNDNEPDFNLSAVGADYMAFSCNNIDFSGWIANSTSYSSFNMETGAGCTEGDGQKTIYVKYKDEAGNEGAYANDATILDRTAPVISGVISSGVMRTSATIEWTTDELSNSVINYNTTTPLEKSVSDVSMVKNHSVTLTGLSPGETYYYEVKSTDFVGNTAIENNSGDYYTFTTLSVLPKTITLLPDTAVDSGVNDVITEVQVSDDTYATLNVKRAEGYVEMNFLTDIPDDSIINSVIFSYEHHETVDNAVYVEVWDGNDWVRHGGIIRGSDTTDSVDVTTEIYTETEVENSTIKYVCYDGSGGPEKCYLDHAKLSITYTPLSHQLPELSVVVTSLSTVNVNDTFIVDAVISNLGDETATDVNALIALPAALSTDDPLNKYIGSISGRDSETVSWNVSANTIGIYNITVNASATNAASASGNTTIGVVTDSNTMHVASIDMSLGDRTAGRNLFTHAIAIVSIVDANGIPVSGATVSGHWSIATFDSDSDMTDTNGNISLYSDEVKNAPSETNFTFTVDYVVGELTYNPDDNIETTDNIIV